MSLKDEHLIKDIFMMNMTFILSIVVVIGMAFIFFVFAKGNYKSQAEEKVKTAQEKINFQVSQINDNIENNNLLWSLIDSTWKSPDKSKAFVKKLADSQKLPRCKGKPCSGDDARLKTDVVSNAQERSIKVGWSRYSFKVFYDSKDKFVTIDASDLLGKSTPQESAEEESSEE